MKKIYLYIRLTLLSAVFIASVMGALSWPEPDHALPTSISYSMVPVIVVFGIIAMFLLFGIQVVNPLRFGKFYAPNWYRNPISIFQLPQFFHFASWSFITSGAAYFMVDLIKFHTVDISGPFFVGMGAGVLFGLKLIQFFLPVLFYSDESDGHNGG